MMNDVLYMVLAFIAGVVLGMIFFGGLWYTVRKAIGTKIPAIWFFGSFILRVGIVMLGFYYISFGGFITLIAALPGFILARLIVMGLTKSLDKKQTEKEIYHEA